MITPRENAIIALYENEGRSATDIAAALGLSRGYVAHVVRVLCHNLGPDTCHQQAMARANAAFLQKLAAAR